MTSRPRRRLRSFPLLIAPLLLALAGCDRESPSGPTAAAGVKVTGPFTTRPSGGGTPAPQEVDPSTAEFYIAWEIPRVAKGDQIEGSLIAVDVGTVVPPGSEAKTIGTVALGDGTQSGQFTFTKPGTPWPPGSYRVDIRHKGTVVGSVSFRIEKSAEPSKTAPASSSEH